MRTPLKTGDAAILSVRPEDLVAADEGIAATVSSMEYQRRAFFGLARSADGSDLYFRADDASPRERRRGRSRSRAGRSCSGIAHDERAIASNGGWPPVVSRFGTTMLIIPGLGFMIALSGSSVSRRGRLAHPEGRRVVRQLRQVLQRSLSIQHDRRDASGWRCRSRSSISLSAVPVAFRVRLMRRYLLTTILVLPITLGTVFVVRGC